MRRPAAAIAGATATLALLGLAVGAGPAAAQGRNHDVVVSFGPAEFDAVRRTATGMVDAPVGTTRTWRSGTAGLEGTLTLLQAEEIDGRPCRTFESAVAGRTLSYPFTLTLCRQPDGSWTM